MKARTKDLLGAALIGFSVAGLIAFGGISYLSRHAYAHGDRAARSDYAGMVNDCYDRNREGSADDMYSCIAAY